jgi:succinate dehydrogenase/fumarate reductase flavoprotein subunit
MCEQIIVVGGGLAGLSAAHTVLEHGGRVLLLDKCPFLGGNSTKATSGINGALTRTQAAQGIDDSADKFETDILKGAAGVGHTDPPEHTVPLAKVRRPHRSLSSLLLFVKATPRIRGARGWRVVVR